MSMLEIITDRMTKAFIYAKFYLFVKQMRISKTTKEQGLKRSIRAKSTKKQD